MATIDTNTGLPELPADHFWKVNETSVEIRKRLPDTEWRERSRYGSYLWGRDDHEEGISEHRQVNVTRKVRHTERRWFRNIETTREVTEAVQQVRYVKRSREVVKVSTPPSGEKIRVPGKWHPDEYASSYDYYGYSGRRLIRAEYRDPDTFIDRLLPVTKATLPSLCEKALERFEALSLIGEYPPKKFESEEN